MHRKVYSSKTDGYSNCDALPCMEFASANLICEHGEQSNITLFILSEVLSECTVRYIQAKLMLIQTVIPRFIVVVALAT